MTSESTCDPVPRAGALARAILWGGGAAGCLDIAFALAWWGSRGAPPARILQGVAAGALGQEAFRGGVASAVLGACFVFTITFAAAAIYAIACRELPVLGRRPLPCGLLYGASVYVFVSQVVVPLSAARQVVQSPVDRLVPLAGCALCVGAPIAFAAARYLTGGLRWASRAAPGAGRARTAPSGRSEERRGQAASSWVDRMRSRGLPARAFRG